MKTALIIGLIVISVILAVVVMMQEGKEGGLTSTLSGSTDTYWSKNKGKSKESILKKITAVLGVIYMVLALLLSSKFIG
ncbi:MAG: preprotein translocase subunit SecG [Wujia sp.]